jgi:hypothetical protein
VARELRTVTGETSTLSARTDASIADCVREEIASIGAIDTAIWAEKDPGYITLLRDAKSEKQAAVEQLSTLLRMRAQNPPEGAVLRETMKEVQALVTGVSRSRAFAAFRAAESRLVERYREIHAAQRERLEREVLSSVLERAIKRWHILTAHLAVLDDATVAAELPRPLSEYFSSSEARVCMRCLFDRPGTREPLRRTKPEPETFVCAACHDEVVAAIPPDLRIAFDRHSIEARQALVIEKALGRPQRVVASRTVIAALSGLPIRTPSRDERPFAEEKPSRSWAVDEVEADLVVPQEAASSSESAYRETLFRPEKVSRSW